MADDDPMAFLNAQRAKLAAMSEAADAAAKQNQIAQAIAHKIGQLDAMAADALNSQHVTELTSAEQAQASSPRTGLAMDLERISVGSGKSHGGNNNMVFASNGLVLCTVCFDCPCACRK